MLHAMFSSVYLSKKLIVSLKQSATGKIKLQGYNVEYLKFGFIPCWPECIFWGEIWSNETSEAVVSIGDGVVGNHWATGYKCFVSKL